MPTPDVSRLSSNLFIVVLVFLDLFAYGMAAPVLPRLVQTLSENPTQAGYLNGLLVGVFAFFQFLFSPVLGVASDRYGRRPVLIASIIGLGCNYLLMIFAQNIFWLFAGHAIAGMTSASVATAFAYIADLTPREKRAQAFGRISAAVGLGFVLGPAIGGVLGELGPRVPFWAAATVAIANGIYGVFVLKESLPADNRPPFSWGRTNPVSVLSLLQSNRYLMALGLVTFLAQCAQAVLPALLVIYTLQRYQWNAASAGIALAVSALFAVFVQAALMQKLTARLHESGTVILGLLCGSAGLFIYGTAPTGALFAVGLPFVALYGVVSPAAQAMMSQVVSQQAQGQLQGAVNSVGGIARAIAPIIFGILYSVSSQLDPALLGTSFVLAGLLLLCAVPLAASTRQASNKKDPPIFSA